MFSLRTKTQWKTASCPHTIHPFLMVVGWFIRTQWKSVSYPQSIHPSIPSNSIVHLWLLVSLFLTRGDHTKGNRKEVTLLSCITWESRHQTLWHLQLKNLSQFLPKQQASKLIHQQALFTNTHVRNPKKPYLTAIKSHPTWERGLGWGDKLGIHHFANRWWMNEWMKEICWWPIIVKPLTTIEFT